MDIKVFGIDLSQMHNKTDENEASMLSELARTGFYKKIEVKSRLA